MMLTNKDFKTIISILLAFAVCVFFQSCYDDNPVNNVTKTPFVKGYIPDEAADCMTLSSLAYVNENNVQYLRDSLIIQLANTGYSTQGKWILDWGPSLNSDQSNLMYIVKDTSTNPDFYAIVVRGTDWCFPTNWEEDVYVWDLVSYPYGSPSDSIAYGTSVGLNELLGMRDPQTNRTLVRYLNSIENGYMFITGHSLGGALATVMTSWFMDNGYTKKFKMKSYTFAAPSVGNPGYVNHFNSTIATTGSESHRVMNPKDLVPRFQNELDSVIYQQIPTFVPISIEGVLVAIEGYFDYYSIVYEHVGTRQTLSTIIPFGCGNSGSFDDYKCWVLFEHHPDTYLTLMNAPPTNVSYVPCNWLP